MKYKYYKHVVVSIAACSLLFQPVLTGTDVKNQSVVSASTVANKIVKLNANSHLAIRDAQLLMQEQNLVLAFTVLITNNGSKELNLLDYWVRIKGKSGKLFSTVLSEKDKEKKTVAPKSSTYITYYAKVDNQTKLSDLSFNVIMWDFSAPNYERSLGTIKYPMNATGKVPVFQPSVMLIGDTKVKGAVKQFFVTEDVNGMYLTVSYLLENIGYTSINLSNIGFAIQTDTYSVYNLGNTSSSQVTIQPKERKIVTMQANLPTSLKGKEVALLPYINEESSKIKLPTGLFAIPDLKPAASIATGKSRNVFIEGELIRTSAGTAIVNESDEFSEIGLDISFENLGFKAVQMPDLEFALQTKDKKTYPINYVKSENNVLLPSIEKTISLNGTVPKSVKEADLIVKKASSDESAGYVIGVYQIKSASQQGNIGSSYLYNDNYNVQLSSIQRSPLSGNDVITAELKITNASKSTKSIPDLSGFFTINGVKVEKEITSINLDDSINIAPGGTYNVIVYTKIPYTTEVDKITFVLTEKKDQSEKRLFQFSSQKISSVSLYSQINGYKIDTVGTRAQVKVKKVNIFEGNGSNYFYTEFEAINLEPRTSDLANIGGYLKDKNGLMVPIHISEVKNKIMPNGKVLISAWATTPDIFDSTNYQLIFGQSISSADKEIDGESSSEAVIVQPVAYSVKNDLISINKELKDINISASSLSLRNLVAMLHVSGLYNVEGIRLTLDYDLSIDNSYDYIAGDHKILFEFVNQDTAKVTYSKEYALFNSKDGGSSLIEGTNIPLEIIFNDPDVQSKIIDYKTYKLNIYDVIGDTKFLIASKELRWFVRE